MSVDYRRGPRCGYENCPSRDYYVQDGRTFCRRDHQQDVPLQTQEGDDDFGKKGHKNRKKKETAEKISRIYKGKMAVELYLQCYQLILRKQCWSLIHDKGFPSQLEIVVHDLWSLRLQLLQDKSTEDLDSGGDSRLYSSQPETTENEDESTAEKQRKKERGMPRLVETLGLCYLAMMLLRVPISLGDLHKWAVHEEIPYVRAIRLIPSIMTHRLPPELIGALDLRSPLKPDSLHHAVHRLLATYYRQFDMTFPSLNYHPLLLSFILQLALPIDLYTPIIHMAEILPNEFTSPQPTYRQRVSALPELQLISMLVIAVKLYHPFDGLERHLKSPTDFGNLTIDWVAWNMAREEYRTKISAEGPPSSSTLMATTDRDIFTMSPSQIDDYLDWYEKTWINDTPKDVPKPRAPPEQLLTMFPTSRLDIADPDSPLSTTNIPPQPKYHLLTERLNHVQSTLKVRAVISAESTGEEKRPLRRIGTLYKRYRRVKDLLSSEHARHFYEESAEVVGVSVKTLLNAVFTMELGLQKGRDLEVEKALEGEEDEEDDEEEEDDDDEGEREAGGRVGSREN